MNKIPDILDFFVTKGIARMYTRLESILDLSSDHTPFKLLMSTGVIPRQRTPFLDNKKTDWEASGKNTQRHQPENLLKTHNEIDAAAEYFTEIIQSTARSVTPPIATKVVDTYYPKEIKDGHGKKTENKWQITKHPANKTVYNEAIRELKKLIGDYQNESIQQNLQTLKSYRQQTTHYGK